MMFATVCYCIGSTCWSYGHRCCGRMCGRRCGTCVTLLFQVIVAAGAALLLQWLLPRPLPLRQRPAAAAPPLLMPLPPLCVAVVACLRPASCRWPPALALQLQRLSPSKLQRLLGLLWRWMPPLLRQRRQRQFPLLFAACRLRLRRHGSSGGGGGSSSGGRNSDGGSSSNCTLSQAVAVPIFADARPRVQQQQ